MHSELIRCLELQRAKRKFDPELYLRAKLLLLNEYMLRSGLQACVLGVSGGVDSAVALGILQAAARIEGSQIKKIAGVLMPVSSSNGCTGQDEASARGREVLKKFGAEEYRVDLGTSHAAVKAAVDQGLRITGDAWAAGQLVSNLRTPALYYCASLLAQ